MPTQIPPIAGSVPLLRIDLNMLRGDRIRTRRDFAVGRGFVIPALEAGQMVRAIEEEGDAYLATVTEVDGMRVVLRLDLDSVLPSATYSLV